MYGRGNYAPQFGQGLQRPMPPFQQPPAGHPAPLQFQPGQPFPMQQGGIPHGGPPRGPGYPHVLPAPLNAGQSFVQRPLVQGGPPARYPFPGSQQNISSGAPNPPPSIGPLGSLPPPPLLRPAAYGLLGPRSNPGSQQGVHHMSLLPPPPPHAPTGFFPLPPQPPPPQPASSLPMAPNMPSSSIAGGLPMTHADVPQKQILESASVEVKTDGGREGSLMSHADMSTRESAPLELSSPPKPADETVLRNIEVLCQFIAKNGSQFEEMARKNESGNPKFSFLVGGEPGSEASCAREYYLWMKKKYGLLDDSGNGQEEKNLSQSHPDVNVATVHSPADSDVDMEDDITQTDKGSDVYNSVEDLNSGSVSTGVMLEMQKQETMLLYANDGSSALKSPPVNSEEQKEIKPEDSSGQLGRNDSSFRLIQNYDSEDNSGDELPNEQGGVEAVTPPPRSAVPPLCDDKSGTTFEPGFVHSAMAFVDKVLTEQEALAVQTESLGTLTKGGSSDNREIDGRYDGDEPSNLNPAFHGSSGIDTTSYKGIEALAVQSESQGISTDVGLMGKHAVDDKFDADESNMNPTFQERYATGSSGANTAGSRDNERKDTLSAVKVDEFGRLVKEGASDSDSDDNQHVRHRGRKNRSRSRSRSPSDRKRRNSPLRSPRRRKGRRSRSRSRSPKRRRSRSRSPFRSVGDFDGEKLRRGKVQTQECFDFSKGRCYRGASCRYLHHDMDFKSNEGHREDASHVRGASEVHMPQHPIGREHPTFEMPSMSQSVHSLAGTHKKRDDNSTMVGSGPSVVRDGGSQPVSSYASEPLVREQSSHVASAGVSGIAAHYNPYASTFDQPLSSRFSSAFAQQRVSSSGIKYDHSFSLSHGPGEGQAASGYGSRQIFSSPNSSRAEDRMPRLGGVQYDPLFDSIEPSSKPAVKEDQAADNSNMLKVGSHKMLDVAENKQKEVVATTSIDNDEYGETADAEVGVVENGSLSDTDDDAIIAEGEIEIDQMKGGGNDKTSKDSRSMKLFKVAVANFVKEVLKPQWRQGNMSKEVFKTIVKKTVDKVSGAMKNHRVPKSQAKIDQYINSSRRKLIQLVEGYVSKYKS